MEAEAWTGRGRFGFVFHSVIQQKTGGILRCRLLPSSLVLTANEHGGADPPLCLTGQFVSMFPSIAVLASGMTPPHWPEWRRMYLIYPDSSQ